MGLGAQFTALGGSKFQHEVLSKAVFYVNVKNKVNKNWLHGHINDPYVKLAQKEGFRARAAYKLQEIDEEEKLIRPVRLLWIWVYAGQLGPVRAPQAFG